MSFETLKDRLGPLPEFHPLTPPTPPVINTSGMVRDMTEGIDKIVSYMSPFEREKRQQLAIALKVKKRVFEDYEKHPEQYDILPNGGFRKRDDKLDAYKHMMYALNLKRAQQSVQLNQKRLQGAYDANEIRRQVAGYTGSSTMSSPHIPPAPAGSMGAIESDAARTPADLYNPYGTAERDDTFQEESQE